MKNFYLTLVISCLVGCLPAQDKFSPRSTTLSHLMGDSTVRISVSAYGNRNDIVFINLHSDETTSVESAEKLLAKRGGLLIRIENNNKRNITFGLKGQSYTFDPNRMFSRKGIEASLGRFKNTGPEAVDEVEKLASRVIALIPGDNVCVVALHNNTEGRLSIQSYMPGNEYGADAQEVFANHHKDPDDFFLTTDSLLFQQVSSAQYNSVLQDNKMVQQDGSLSVYFGEKNKCYLNCETEHGKLETYNDMLSAAIRCIEERKRMVSH
jgi:hypothetical protein